MANAYYYSNAAIQTTLTGNVSAGGLSIGVVATTGFPTSYPYVLALDYGAATEELVTVTAAAGTTLTLGARGHSGTSAQSHSLGAVVRHVFHAGDATDFRTHEAATADVHGVTGALVGATQVQTLTNKTLTSPTINGGVHASGGSFAGTFTGTPTFSGALTLSGAAVLSGTPSISNGAALSGTFTGTPTFSGNVTHSGEIVLTNLLRGSRALAADSMYESRVTADSVARWVTLADGKTWWGPGNAVVDTNLYRSAADTLRTDDALSVGGVLTAANASLDSISTVAITHSSGMTYKPDQNGTVSMSFGPATSSTTNVTFTTAFGSIPRVFTNINSGVAATASWGSRAISVSTTGFTVFVFGPSATWSSVEVQWSAVSQ